MLSIFDVDPPISGTPTTGLKKASDDLLEAATDAVRRRSQRLEQSGFESRSKFIRSVIPTMTQDEVKNARERMLGTISLELFEQKIEDYLARQYGRHKGPVQNAVREIPRFAKRASSAGYPLEDEEVQKEFADFVLSYVTNGMQGEDTTGTQMGNFRGGWRGGGFG